MTNNNHSLRADINDCRIIKLPTHCDPAGNLIVAQNSNNLPFAIERVFYIYDIPTDAHRGGHAHYREQQLIVAAAGCFDVEVTDGTTSRTFTLRRPSEALYVPAGLWRAMKNFAGASVCLTLSSTHYDENDYIRNFDQYLSLLK